MNEGTRKALAESLDILCCPRCQGELRLAGEGLSCSACDTGFPVEDEIPRLFAPHDGSESRQDVTERMKAFYEETPFPDYDDFDSVASLISKARQGIFAKQLDDQIPPTTRILECGCGTGQLSSFLSLANRTVFGTDMCLNSLRLGQAFKEKNRLERVRFMQMNLFRPSFRAESFDVVISNGVLHHTSDPRLGFRMLSMLVRPGGYILVGLYHRYGRLITDFRRAVFRLSRDRFTVLDPNLRDQDRSTARRLAWFRDQYKNPHESKHTMGEVMGWLRECGLCFVSTVPRSKPFQPISEDDDLFDPQIPGSRVERLCVELGMIPKGSREGGFFVTVARKP